MPYWLWIPIAVIYYAGYALLSKQNAMYGGKWFWITLAYGAAIPLWAIVSRYSKNLLFDGMLYDNILFLTYVITMIFIGESAIFNEKQWFGLVLIVMGSVIMRAS